MKKSIFLFLIGLATFTAISYADWVQGTVGRVDGKANTVTLHNVIPDDKDDKYPTELTLKVPTNVKLKNIVSLEDVKTGNTVRADVEENKKLGLWEAEKLELGPKENV